MKKITLSVICFLIAINLLRAQYCMLPGQTAYSNLQPGITNFQLNTINRTSGNVESASSVVVATGLSTTLTAGQAYTFSISHSEDTQFFQGARNNLRVWIDFNNNFSYTDAGETVLSVDLEAPATTYTYVYTIPSTITSGTYALRATAKMSSDAGHTLPTPCNSPADPLGYHGEMEDYMVIVENPNAGQSPTSAFVLSSTVCLKSQVTASNSSTGNPSPTYSWTSIPATGVTFSPSSTSTNPVISFSNVGNFSITCKATNSVSSNSSTKVISVSACGVGLNEINSRENVTFYPNPAKEFIVLNPAINIKNVRIFDAVGRQVYNETAKDEIPLKLNISALENGIYFIELNSTDQQHTIKQLVISK
ncbi:MAG: T9SS type A sorting domain-containing protein [Bacteroidia bacterium]|nr:T9SS type A sorting domain-containing protein [Bacteroidia bacterium]